MNDKPDKVGHIMELIEELTSDELVDMCQTVMSMLACNEDPRRYAKLFDAFQENDPETLDEFTDRFAERSAETEEQENG